MSVAPKRHFRVFLASPGDVSSERATARRVLEQLQYDPFIRGTATLELVAWDEPGGGTPMLATKTPQAAIAAGLPEPKECDIVVVIIWARMGTPLPAEYVKADGGRYRSGTEWEYINALEASEQTGQPVVIVYRRVEAPSPSLEDEDYDDKVAQWKTVKEFLAEFKNPDGSIKRGINEYPGPEKFEELLTANLRKVIADLLASPNAHAHSETLSSVHQPDLWPDSPFPGLSAFTTEEAPIYFGRTRETEELLKRLRDPAQRFVAVVGASGSGKSSLVAAGLIPRLQENAIEGSKDWLLPGYGSVGAGKDWSGLRMTPAELSDDPFQNLAMRLLPLLPEPRLKHRDLADQLRHPTDKLAEMTAIILSKRPAWSELLLYVDQGEELFTVVTPDQRSDFIDFLLRATQTPRLRTVMTVRADFYHHFVDVPEFADVLNKGTYTLPPPTTTVLLDMIERPAARAGLLFEPENLPKRMYEDTGTEPGALALLAFALRQLWEGRQGGVLSQGIYDAFGGVSGAIGHQAEAAFKRLAPGIQACFKTVFNELAEVSEDGTEQGATTRRRVPYESLAAKPGNAEFIHAFVEARLLVADGLGDQAVIEVAHEKLFSAWPRLKDWIQERRDDLRLRRQVELAAKYWDRDRSERKASHLWLHERQQPVYDALKRLGTTVEQCDEPLRSFLKPEWQRLVEELEHPDTTHYRRADIGDRLDQIGDPRSGVGLRDDGLPDIAWVDVDVPEGSTVTLEDNNATFEIQPFRIARYPVTYRQYRAFVEAKDGYANQRWWRDLKREDEPGEQYRQRDNCPADNVSWYDAMAYCRWLSDKLGLAIRLPTEWEWQQTATGGDAKHIYPWGQEWDERLVNSTESKLGRTTAVGMYPRGATKPQGTSKQSALDMAGNVEEWCANEYEQPERTGLKGDERRVVRGGSWRYLTEYCRCAYRYGNYPDNRYHDLGFRLCCSPSIP